MWENNQHHTSIVDYPLVYRQDSLPCGIHLRAFKDFKQKRRRRIKPLKRPAVQDSNLPADAHLTDEVNFSDSVGETFGLGLKFSKCEPSAAAALR